MLTDFDPRTIPVSLALRHALRPAERISVSAWADRYRMLTKESGAAEPGPWRTARIPYARDIMDAFGDPMIREIDIVKSARVGMTECGNNMLAYAVDQDPGPCLYVYPDESAAKDECRNRLQPMIEQSPRLKEHIPHPGWATQVDMNLGNNARIAMAWASSPATLIRRTFRYVFIDEIDNCQRQAGVLGDIISLARKRTLTYGARAKLVVYTSPTVVGAPAWTRWESCPDRRRYFVPCPHCGAYQVLVFDQIKIPPGERDPERIEFDSLGRYQCLDCRAPIDYAAERGQRWMVARGLWLSEGLTPAQRLPLPDEEIVERATFDHPQRWTPRVEGTRPRSRRVAFHVWAGYSPWVSWSAIIAEFLRTQQDCDQLRVFFNQVLGEPWRESADEVPATVLEGKRQGARGRDVVPAAAEVLLVSADVQKDRIYYVVRAWGVHKTSWLIREGIVADLEDLMQVAQQVYRREDGKTMTAACLAVDTGYRTFEVYDLALSHPGVYAIKGQPNRPYPVAESNLEYQAHGYAQRRVVKLYHVDTHYFKDMLAWMIRVPEGESGCFHLNRDVSDDYCQQVSAEHLTWVSVRRKKRKVRERVWLPKRENAPNHYLDCEVYGLALAYHRRILQLKPAEPPATAEPSVPRPRFGRGPMGWKPPFSAPSY